MFLHFMLRAWVSNLAVWITSGVRDLGLGVLTVYESALEGEAEGSDQNLYGVYKRSFRD